jgi:hypothetical protein
MKCACKKKFASVDQRKVMEKFQAHLKEEYLKQTEAKL